jgi:hypothetical protein
MPAIIVHFNPLRPTFNHHIPLWSILFCSIFSSFEQIPFEEKVWVPTRRRAAMA